MATVVVDAVLLKKMFLSGAKNLELNKELVNELNVFPVPDGDTGTNMTLTILSAAKAVQAVEDVQMSNLAKAISSGSLRGARGNSGVILSQLLRGFCKEISSVQEINEEVLASSFERAVETAYKAVMKPKEGTILTVAKSMADKAQELASKHLNIETMLGQIIEEGNQTLQRTPDLLPVLKEAGVVDSGGQGLMFALQGAYSALIGKELKVDIEPEAVTYKPDIQIPQEDISTADIKFGYCTEFIVNLPQPLTDEEEEAFKSYLLSIGDSLVLVADDEIVKVHVHTNDPGLAIQKGLSHGSLSRMKIDNMREEHNEKLIKDAQKIAQMEEQKRKQKEHKQYGFIAVSIGAGIDEIFKGLHVDALIAGGQTMNPSTDDMLNAIAKVHADNIFILPNNKNIILAAEQAAELTTEKKVIVIPSKTIPQGISALINFSPEKSAEENRQSMIEEMQNIKTGQVTYAVRDTSVDGKTIHNGDIMGIDDHSIAVVGTNVEETTLELLKTMVDEDAELISIYYGADVTEEAAQNLEEQAAELFEDCDIEMYAGNQPIYYYLVSVE